MKGRKIGHAPSSKRAKIDHALSIKRRKLDMPYSELLTGIDMRLKNLRDADKVYMKKPIKFGGLIADGRSRIDEIESFRAHG